MKHHYTTLGLVPVVLEYEHYPRTRMYDEEDGTYEIVPAQVQIYDVFIDGERTKGVQSFADWQLSAWEREIMDIVDRNRGVIHE